MGGLVLVPTQGEVPGGAPFARLDTCAYVVAADNPETVSLLYLLLREQVAMLTVAHESDSEIDLAQVEARLNLALEGVAELDEVGRLGVQAQKALEKLTAIGRQTQQKVRDSLTGSTTLLHP
jgi:hypothetical protein